jgi:spore coat polysaccharide biosynthesis protein SpsF (cytidylyltransferase family)
MGRQFSNFQALTKMWLLVPSGDEIKEKYQKQIMVYEGDADDVLSRYVDVARMEKADYIVRITADCLHIPSFMISRAIKAAVKRETDYVTNVVFRTSMEGFDVEVISKRLLDYLDENAKGEDREHVTTLIRNNLDKFPFTKKDRPSICHIIDAFDLSWVKTSIDTEEEYLAAISRDKKYRHKIEMADKFGYALIP